MKQASSVENVVLIRFSFQSVSFLYTIYALRTQCWFLARPNPQRACHSRLLFTVSKRISRKEHFWR